MNNKYQIGVITSWHHKWLTEHHSRAASSLLIYLAAYIQHIFNPLVGFGVCVFRLPLWSYLLLCICSQRSKNIFCVACLSRLDVCLSVSCVKAL